MIDPLVSHSIAIAMALLLFGASYHKYRSVSRFRAALANYRLLPTPLVEPFAWLLPALELTLGICWLLYVFVPQTALATAGLMLLYAMAIGINVARGRVHIDCGCGGPAGTEQEQPISLGLVIRNVGLATIAALPALPVVERNLQAADFAAVGATVLIAVLLYAAMTQLLHNGAAIRAWRMHRG